MNNICEKYCRIINEKFPDLVKSIIFYGSNIYNEKSSDLDVCLIVDTIDLNQQEKIIEETLNFHKENELEIDEEIPHENKLIYTTEEIIQTLSNPPFVKNGKILIQDIVKSEDYLSSKEMKQRLLLNILTTDHITIGISTRNYELKALKIMIKTVIEYFKINPISEEEILNCLYTNKYTGSSGEMYLGYKKNNQEKEMYLRRKIHETLKR